MYSMLNCRQCVQTELLLEDAGVLFEKIVVRDPEERATLRAQYNATTFPILVDTDGKVFVGFQGAQQMVDLVFDMAF